MQAMILAAGFGTRLLPHTKVKPKPLFPILNKPLLLMTVNRLKRYGFSHIIVNCHHLSEQIMAALQDIEGVILQQEKTLLGTGGGLRKALSSMENSPLLVTNGDIYHTVDYGALYRAHCENRCSATLAMHDYPRFNTVPVDSGSVCDFNSSGKTMLAFTGLHILEPSILEYLADGEYGCVIELYKRLLESKHRLNVYRTDDCFWTDMGTPADYLALHEGLLTGTIPPWEELEYDGASRTLVADNAELAGDNKFCDWCSIGNITATNVKLTRVVAWDGLRLPDGLCVSDEILSTSFR